MSATLNPSVPTVTSIRASIQAMLKAEMPADLLATSVAPLLVNVNKWADQIPAVLEGPGAVNVNLVFSIRKDLFVVPSFTQSTFGPVLAELPAPFKDFINFTYKLIEAQKPNDKDKPVPKVCPSFSISNHHVSYSHSFRGFKDQAYRQGLQIQGNRRG